MEKSTEIAKFISAEDLTEKFKYVSSKLPILEKSSLDLKVESEEGLTIAQNNASEAHTLLKEVEKVRKLLKQPYADTASMIDTYCGTIKTNLERIKLRFTSEVTNYKNLQEARLKMEREAKMKELSDLEKAKTEESAKITRIESQMIARIYGGSFQNKSGETKVMSGCHKPEECEELLSWINENAPSVDSFVHFPGMFEDMIVSVKKKLTEHQVNLIDISKTQESPIAREGAMRRITESRIEAVQEVQQNATVLQKNIEKTIKKEVRTIDNEIKDAGKGIREDVTFEVQDETAVPRDMLSVDEKKINKYLDDNKDTIKDKIAKGEEIIPGIKFFVSSKFVTR